MSKKNSASRYYAGEFKIFCNFADEALVPHEAFERKFFERCTPFTDQSFITNDGVKCNVEFIGTWAMVKDGELDHTCESRWGCKFSAVRSMWIDRLMRVGDTWHLIRMTRI